MKKIFCFVLCCFFYSSAHCQLNLVYNPSFEDTTECPSNYQQIFLTRHWSGVDSNWNADSIAYGTRSNLWTPCLEHTCANGPSSIAGCPDNRYFYQYPRTGSAMVECAWYTSSNITCFSEFSYLQGRLIHPLSIGKSYCVTFYVNMENGSGFAVNNIGAYFDDGSIDTVTGSPHPLLYPAQVVETGVISDTVNWVKVQGSFTATGTERFITIGIFADTATITKVLYNPYLCWGQYLIDDVSVIASDSSADAGPDVHIAHGGDTVQIGISNGAGMPCYWYLLGGTAPIDSGGSTIVHPDTTTRYVVEMDLCGRVTRDTVTVWVGNTMVNYQLLIVNARVYPNPASQVLNVEGAARCGGSICNIVGQVVFQTDVEKDKESIDISRLEQGVYFVHIADKVTGEEVVRKVVKE